MADVYIKDEPCDQKSNCIICSNEIANRHIVVRNVGISGYLRYLDYCSEECKVIILFQLAK